MGETAKREKRLKLALWHLPRLSFLPKKQNRMNSGVPFSPIGRIPSRGR
jgi:hypothetical protein